MTILYNIFLLMSNNHFEFYLHIKIKINTICWQLMLNMSRVCQITGKKSSGGNNRSHAMNATKRKWDVNLTERRIFNPGTGKLQRMKVSIAALRTMCKSAK